MAAPIQYVDYLSFIQVSIAFNFAAVFWNRKLQNDSIERLFAQDKDTIRRKADQYKKEIENVRSAVDDWQEMSNEEKVTFLKIKEEFETCYQAYVSTWNRFQYSLPCSYCFNIVCVLLGLYGIMQLCLLPDIMKSLILWDAYLYSTEIISAVLLLLLILELICKCTEKSEPFYFIKFSIWAGVFIFLFSYILSKLKAEGIFASYKLFCREESLVYGSIYLSYISFVVYFILQSWEHVRMRRRLRYLGKLSNRMSSLSAEKKKLSERSNTRIQC